MALTREQQLLLLNLAQSSIIHELAQIPRLSLELKHYPKQFTQTQASFVTLEINQQLRGCIGSLQAHRPLITDIIQNAKAAAFSDPRFPMVTLKEYPQLSYHISLLNPPQPLMVESEQDLLNKLQPNIDGLILQAGHHKATFLPTVWQQLPKAKDFWQHLKHKAGLPMDYWSDSIELQRYTTESFS